MAQAQVLPPPAAPGLATIWKIFVSGLIAFVLIGLVFVGVNVSLGQDPGELVTLVTAGLTGIISIFVSQP